VIVLAIDTCDARGSVAVLRDEAVLKVVAHDSDQEYSAWLLPAVREALGGSGLQMEDVDAYAAAAGPGSFTGVRVGLATVKAWVEFCECATGSGIRGRVSTEREELGAVG
jgi:tRNA threonylcarbamoyladenosine biosynthesis protein TsaB